MNRIFLLGDIHGRWQPIRDLNTRLIKKFDDTDTIILLGDSGLNYYLDKRDDSFKEKMSKCPCTFFVVRGNHEQRPTILATNNTNWEINQYYGNLVWAEKKYPRIKYAMDTPCVYYIDKYKTLIIPGAYSVDKYYRLQNGWNWFEQEQLNEKERQLGRDTIARHGYNFDLVLSHTCPICYEPTDLFLSGIDQSLVDRTMEQYLGEIEYKIQYKLWCWGHYHHYRVYPNREGRQPLMLYNDAAIELNEWMEALPSNIGKTY